MDTPYKQLKEDFVSGHSGSSIVEVQFVVSASLLIPLLLHRLTQCHLRNRGGAALEHQPSTALQWALLELTTLVVPVVLFPTIPAFGAAVSIILVVALIVSLKMKRIRIFATTMLGQPKKTRIPYITEYRGLMMLITCVAILAVDFPVFPRRHAKTEKHGVSLMDLGVGSLVLSSGLVAGRPQQLASISSRKTSLYQAPLLLLIGGARLLSVKAVNYAEHTSEYGVHWNFFWTLACLTVMHSLVLASVTTIGIPLGQRGVFVMAVVIAVVHQCALSVALESFVEHQPRIGFVSANKEGIVSLTGYYSIFLFGVSLGASFFKSTEKNQWWFLATVLVLAGGVLHTWTPYSPPSRRVINASYIAWVLGANVIILAGCKIIDNVLPYSQTQTMSYVHATSENQLVVFLVANLLTGATNLCADTMHFGDGAALAWLVLYMSTVCTFARHAYHNKWTVRSLLHYLTRKSA
eukprot:m.97197 g.97197  ORF g.97197 m.97197 type:complete len:465 (+) comp26957_c0_seq2:201-1595(+)